ncbi:related to pyridine nucleotide-disulphide oxidoreductase AMID-like [Cephalotrichum gorgonifer]|uniref:Related to pyridine nucleotide-disulphide oxidoreductase AMID-like n=1 Tax=Cephalotrichum gorgonifer TaxID=2041049 RepID=A0AAE8N5R6_9PEZI|nr:related to pyridine nucleotide-disulphide oxidoreductase AMID-like [Cephalotrichum gorgonifer]
MSSPTPASAAVTKVLVIGGSYAGLSATVNLLDLGNHIKPRFNYPSYKHDPEAPRTPVEITIVDERDGFYHLIGSPLAFASDSYAPQSWTRFVDIPALQTPAVRFVQGSVASVDPEAKTASIVNGVTKEVSVEGYDFLLAATGLRRVFPVQPQSLSRKAFLLEAEEHIHAVKNAVDGVVVVGGGAVGIEMAAELKLVHPDVKVTLVHSREKLLSSEPLDEEMKDRALELLQEAGVETIMGRRVKETRTEMKDGIKKMEVELSDGSKLAASEVIMALSKSVPSSTYLPASAVDEEGYVKITPSLHLEEGTPNATSHFVAGDVARWSGIKRCGGAMHMGFYAAVNIHQMILSRVVPGHVPAFMDLVKFEPSMGLAVGKKAVASGPGVPVTFGEDVMKAYFGDDLGLSICWDYIQLSTEKFKERNLA